MPESNFPLRRAVTRGFRNGAPRNLTLSKEGDALLFLRSDSGDDTTNHLWRMTWSDSTAHEVKLVDASELLGAADEELPEAEKARRERLRESSGGITGFSTDGRQSRVCFTLGGQLWVYDLATGRTYPRPGDSATTPVIDPTGSRIAFTSGNALMITSAAEDSTEPVVPMDTGEAAGPEDSHRKLRVLASSDDPNIIWGRAEFIAAEEMGRYRGFWWSPDGQQLLATYVDESAVPIWSIADPAHPDRTPRSTRYPHAGAANASVRLFLMNLNGQRTEVCWDRDGFEYLARVHWSNYGHPILAVQSRDQQQLQIRSIDPGTGESEVAVEQSERPWIELVPGVPLRTVEGIVTTVVDQKTDTRRLALFPHLARDNHNETRDNHNETKFLTPAGLQIRSVSSSDGTGLTFSASQTANTQDLFRVEFNGGLNRVSSPGAWASGSASGGTTVTSRAEPDTPRSTVEIRSGDACFEVRSNSETPGPQPKPEWLSVGTEEPNVAVLWPSHSNGSAGTRAPEAGLPIIMSPYGGPHAQRAIKASSAFLTEQWMADQGFCVVVADGPGSPRSPEYETLIHGDLAGPPLQGQVDGLAAVVHHYGDRVDPNRVGIRGWSFGGFLAALAVLERPDLFHAAVAGAPVTDWRLYDTHYTERYLGLPDTDPDAYERSDLLGRAAQLSRPLMIIHGLSDDNVFAAHTLQFSSALLAAGKPHTVLPLTGVTHMTPQEVVAENLLRLDFEFLRDALADPQPTDGVQSAATQGEGSQPAVPKSAAPRPSDPQAELAQAAALREADEAEEAAATQKWNAYYK